MKITKVLFIKQTIVFIFLMVSLGFLVYSPALEAQTLWEQQEGMTQVGNSYGTAAENPRDFRNVVVSLVGYLLTFIALICTVLIVYGGYIWMTSLSYPDRVDRAKKIIRNAVIGLVVIIVAYTITKYVIVCGSDLLRGETVWTCDLWGY